MSKSPLWSAPWTLEARVFATKAELSVEEEAAALGDDAWLLESSRVALDGVAASTTLRISISPTSATRPLAEASVRGIFSVNLAWAVRISGDGGQEGRYLAKRNTVRGINIFESGRNGVLESLADNTSVLQNHVLLSKR